jgi:hypothetical protein
VLQVVDTHVVMASSHVKLGVDGIIVDSAEDVMAKLTQLAV